MDQPALALSEQRQLRRDRAELNELRALGLDCLEHAPERSVSFGSMAARLERGRCRNEADPIARLISRGLAEIAQCGSSQ